CPVAARLVADSGDDRALLRVHLPDRVRQAAAGPARRARSVVRHRAGRTGDRAVVAPDIQLRALGQYVLRSRTAAAAAVAWTSSPSSPRGSASPIASPWRSSLS